jgi:protein-tyrosine phosphatase
MHDSSKLRPFVSAGCLVQLTADALVGEFGEVCEARAIEFLEQGWVTVIASDAHDIESRPPRIRPGLEVARRILGEDTANNLVHATPRRIVHGT